MAISDLIPWRREPELSAPIVSLQRQMNRMFDEFFGRSSTRWPRLVEEIDSFLPNIDIEETDDMMEVSAELPGLSEKDIDVVLSPDGTTLTIKGEKRVEKEKKERGYYRSERTFGAFRRTVALPVPALDEKIDARFHNGVLTVELRKNKAGNGEKHIKVKPV